MSTAQLLAAASSEPSEDAHARRPAGGATAIRTVLFCGCLSFALGCTAQATPVAGELKAGQVPTPYRDLVSAAGELCSEVSAQLLAAQLDAESGWNPDAVSSAGARGIAQFMPGTWPTWAVDGNGNGTASPFEPADAIPAQAAFMCSLADTMQTWLADGVVDGEPVDLMLAGYNAGAGSVEVAGGVPPYSETLAYIDRIKAGIAAYTTTGASDGPVSAGEVVLPVPQGSYTHLDNFGESGSSWDDYHTGDDFSAPCGTPVLAAHSGTVAIDTSQSWSGQWLVKVSTGPADLTTWYAHMQSLAVSDGQTVAGGGQLGTVGEQGNSTGCHLHFEVHPTNGSIYVDPVDPAQWLVSNGVQP